MSKDQFLPVFYESKVDSEIFNVGGFWCLRETDIVGGYCFKIPSKKGSKFHHKE